MSPGHVRRLALDAASITAIFVLLSLLIAAATTTYAQDDLATYLPTPSELGLMRGGFWTTEEYEVETGEKAGPSGEGNIGAVFLSADVRNPEAEDDDLPVKVRIIQYSSIGACEGYFQFHPIDYYHKHGNDPHLIKQERIRSVGEDAFYVIFTNDPGNYLYIEFYFRKNVYYVEVYVSGYRSVEAIYELTEQGFDFTVGSIASLNDAEFVARMVERKLPGAATTRTTGTTPTDGQDGGTTNPFGIEWWTTFGIELTIGLGVMAITGLVFGKTIAAILGPLDDIAGQIFQKWVRSYIFGPRPDPVMYARSLRALNRFADWARGYDGTPYQKMFQEKLDYYRRAIERSKGDSRLLRKVMNDLENEMKVPRG